MKDPNEIGALWIKEKNGKKWLSGKINGQYVVVFRIKDKKSEKSPDYRVLLSQKREETKHEEPQADEGF